MFLKELGYEHTNLNNTVLLITSSTHCSSCIEELKFWSDYSRDNLSKNIYHIVIERHNQRYRNFIRRNNLNIDSFKDGKALLPKNDLIPFIPIKIYFGENEKIKRFHSIGGDNYLEVFLNEIS